MLTIDNSTLAQIQKYSLCKDANSAKRAIINKYETQGGDFRVAPFTMDVPMPGQPDLWVRIGETASGERFVSSCEGITRSAPVLSWIQDFAYIPWKDVMSGFWALKPDMHAFPDALATGQDLPVMNVLSARFRRALSQGRVAIAPTNCIFDTGFRASRSGKRIWMTFSLNPVYGYQYWKCSGVILEGSTAARNARRMCGTPKPAKFKREDVTRILTLLEDTALEVNAGHIVNDRPWRLPRAVVEEAFGANAGFVHANARTGDSDARTILKAAASAAPWSSRQSLYEEVVAAARRAANRAASCPKLALGSYTVPSNRIQAVVPMNIRGEPLALVLDAFGDSAVGAVTALEPRAAASQVAAFGASVRGTWLDEAMK